MSTYTVKPLGARTRDTAAFATAAALMLLVSPIATLLPARRPARVDPMVALRHEQETCAAPGLRWMLRGWN